MLLLVGGILVFYLRVLLGSLLACNETNRQQHHMYYVHACVCVCARVRAFLSALTAPAPHHPGRDSVGSAVAGRRGRGVLLRAHLSSLLLQQVRQRPGEQQQELYSHIL